MLKLDVDTLSTVPDDPPEAGPDRALDPLPLPPAVAEGDVAVGEDVQAAVSPITANISTAAVIHGLLLFTRETGRAETVSGGLVGWSS